MEKPNLFSFATTELSQDAFICWLLSWAKPENKKNDANLHACGLAMIQKFFEKHGKPFPAEIRTVDVKKQDKNIDVLCIVNGEYPIIIEDKTTSKNHSDQLARYYSVIESKADKEKNRVYNPENILRIYFKTFDQSCYKKVEENQYKVFSREDFLAILELGADLGVKSDIFQDFKTRMSSIEIGVQSYLNEDFSQWTSQSWVGFYIKLKQELGTGEWNYVSNATGGFMGFWWGVIGSEKPYLQLEQDKKLKLKQGQLCFKIHVEPKHIEKSKLTAYRRSKRDKWCQKIKKHCVEYGIDLIEPNFGNGKWMTVMIANGDYRCKDTNGLIDINATVQYLKKMDAFLKEMQKLDIE